MHLKININDRWKYQKDKRKEKRSFEKRKYSTFISKTTVSIWRHFFLKVIGVLVISGSIWVSYITRFAWWRRFTSRSYKIRKRIVKQSNHMGKHNNSLLVYWQIENLFKIILTKHNVIERIIINDTLKLALQVWTLSTLLTIRKPGLMKLVAISQSPVARMWSASFFLWTGHIVSLKRYN